MTPKNVLTTAIDPALAFLATLGVESDNRARLELLAIAGQETAWQARLQVGGPARGLWQFEGGPQSGLAEVFRTVPAQLKAVCAECLVPFAQATVFEALAWHDVLAASIARLLLWPDPAPLPEVGDVQGAWAYYQRRWRPGAPHPDIWAARYGTAMGLVAQA